MKIAYPILLAALLGLTACSTTKTDSKKGAPDKPETVMVIYHVKVGAEGEFLTVMGAAWELYRKEHMVFDQPHVVVRDLESGGQSRITEIFTWVNHEAPNKAPDSVKAVWEKEHTLCESRYGKGAIEGGEVELLLPKNK
jgi:hypothetical protein